MTPQLALRKALDMADYICMAYLDDLTDEELFHRADEKINHINWQVGHLIESEHRLMSIINCEQPELPKDFAEKYSRDQASCDDPGQFEDKATLIATYRVQRAATLRTLEEIARAQLDEPTGIDYAPTVADLISMQGSHWMMHAGQWVVVRRQLGRDPLF